MSLPFELKKDFLDPYEEFDEDIKLYEDRYPKLPKVAIYTIIETIRLKTYEIIRFLQKAPQVARKQIYDAIRDDISFNFYVNEHLNNFRKLYKPGDKSSVKYLIIANNLEYLRRLSCGEFNNLSYVIPRIKKMITTKKQEGQLAFLSKNATNHYVNLCIEKIMGHSYSELGARKTSRIPPPL